MRSKETITNNNLIASPALGQVSYSYNQLNQLISATGKTFSYDADGNMTAGYTADGYPFTAGYDAENRLTALSYTAGGVANSINYYYTGDGFLAKRQVYQNGTLVSDTRYIRAGYLPIQERKGSSTVTREYTWGLNMGGGIGGLLNLKQGGQNYSYLYDGKGNVNALLYSNQSPAATYTYDPFGNLLAKTGTLNQPFQFSTKPYDEKTGLSYYGYRFYSPGIGRWVNRDPLEEEGGINLYEFVGGNPINWVDLLGLKKCRGRARVLKGNVRTIGMPGGFSTLKNVINVAAGSAAVIPEQFGGWDKGQLRPYIGQICGKVGDVSFSGITDIIGEKDKNKYKGYNRPTAQ